MLLRRQFQGIPLLQNSVFSYNIFSFLIILIQLSSLTFFFSSYLSIHRSSPESMGGYVGPNQVMSEFSTVTEVLSQQDMSMQGSGNDLLKVVQFSSHSYLVNYMTKF